MNHLPLYRRLLSVLVACSLVLSVALAATAADDEKKVDTAISLGEAKVQLQAPKQWTKLKPRFAGIVDYEFSVTAAEDDKTDGRVTIGGAGGGLEANFERWIAQYSQPDGKSTKDVATREKKKIAGQEVHFIDITGTYKGSQFTNEPMQENFRLLGAIFVTEKQGAYYVKFYGPRVTVAANEEVFNKLLESLKVAE
jgi:hypothetical protein